MTAPITFTWDGEQMVPLPRFGRLCDRVFVVGQTYPLVVEEERSHKSHAHFFASIGEAWKQLPHGLAVQFSTPDALRKWALIEAGFYNQEVIDCGTPEVAERVATFAGRADECAVVSVNGAFVIVRRAKSQSVRSMNKAEFQSSKTAVLDILAGMVGVTAQQLQDEAGRAA